MCTVVNIKWLTSVKEVVSYNFDLAIFSVVSILPDIPETRRITRKAGYSNTTDELIYSEALIGVSLDASEREEMYVSVTFNVEQDSVVL